MRIWTCMFAVAILSVTSALTSQQAESAVELAALKAHYVGKVVTAKTDLPRTDGGFVFVNDDELDTIGLAKAIQGSSSLGVQSGGVGIPKGSDVVIRDIKLKSKYVQFYLGTSKGAEWNKALHALSGYNTTPHVGTKAEPISGSVIVIVKGATRSPILGITSRNSRPLTPEDRTVESLNRSLSQVIDTRALASTEELPPQHQDAIQKGEVVTGMTKQAVFMALGEPSQKQTELSGDDVIDKWIYESETLETVLVLMTNGVVTEVKRF